MRGREEASSENRTVEVKTEEGIIVAYLDLDEDVGERVGEGDVVVAQGLQAVQDLLHGGDDVSTSAAAGD